MVLKGQQPQKLPDDRWNNLHEWFKNNAKAKEAEVLFLGGDHIALLEQSNYFIENLAPLHCLCFGSIGDTAANLLWRIENGETDIITPKVIVVSIGESDFNMSPNEMLDSLLTIATALREKQPSAVIYFLDKASVIDIDSTVIDTNGEIDVVDFFDFIHLSQEGYKKVFEVVLVAINAVLSPAES
uniref:Uncharacterized protein n=1 Tax=Acrobeloides nanus TaxID=290746 RepID=A0A914CVC1_9BILA